MLGEYIMEKNKETLNNTTSFSRSERKAMERAMEEESNKAKTREEKHKAKREDKEVKDILKDQEPLKPMEEELSENTESIKAIEEEELQVGELGKTQHILNMTSEISNILGNNSVEDLYEKEKSSFNPIPWIGILLIICFGFFIYLTVYSKYDKNLLVFIDGGILLSAIFLFSISTICGKTGTKVLSILNLLIILGYAGCNGYFLYNGNQKKEAENPAIEEKLEQKEEEKKKFVCTSEDKLIEENITISNDNIEVLVKKVTITDKEEMEKIKSIFKEENLTLEETEDTLTITFDFTKLDINQYKVIIRDYLDYYRKTSDFTYIEEDKINYTAYKEEELKGFECIEIKEES